MRYRGEDGVAVDEVEAARRAARVLDDSELYHLWKNFERDERALDFILRHAPYWITPLVQRLDAAEARVRELDAELAKLRGIFA